MRAAVYEAGGAVVLHEQDEPVPGPGEVLVAMRACGICGSDLMSWYVDPRAPLVLGHEPVGVVLATGEPVLGPLPAVGARVAVHHHVPCGDCERCRSGHETLCATFKATRIHPGGLAERILVPAPNAATDLLEVPDHLGDAEATLVEPLACSVRGLDRARVVDGTRVLVVGGGQMGLLTALAAVARGARVAVAEPLGARRGVAEGLGLPAVEAVSGAGGAALGGPPEVVMLCTGAESAWELGLADVDRGGRLQLFAPSGPGVERRLPVDRIFFDEVEVQASYSAGPGDMRAALALLAGGAVPGERLVTHRFALEQAGEALAAARSREGLKVVVTSAA